MKHLKHLRPKYTPKTLCKWFCKTRFVNIHNKRRNSVVGVTNLTFECDLRFDVVEWKVTVKSQTKSVLVCVMFWCGGGVMDLRPGEGWFSWRSGRVHGVWDTERNTADGTGRVHNYNRDTMGHCGALTGRDTRHKHTPARTHAHPHARARPLSAATLAPHPPNLCTLCTLGVIITTDLMPPCRFQKGTFLFPYNSCVDIA